MQPPPSPGAPPPPSRGAFRSWRAAVGVLVSLLFLVVAFRGQDPAAVWATLGAVDLRWLPPALGLFFLGVGVRAVRWSVLLRPVAPLSPAAVLPVVLAGYTANNILPLRTGELVRAFLLGQRYGVRKTAAVATIAVERLFDGLTTLVFILAAATALSLSADVQRITLAAALLFALVLGGLILFVFAGTTRDRLLALALRPLPVGPRARVERLADGFLGGLGVLSRRTDLAIVAALSLVAWGFEASMYWTLAQGFGPALAAAMTPAAALLTTGVANLATLVPAAPGYVGTFEAGVALAVDGVLGAGRGVALSYAILLHAALWFPTTLLGAVAWWRFHLSPEQVIGLDEAEAARRPGDRAARSAGRGAGRVWQADSSVGSE